MSRGWSRKRLAQMSGVDEATVRRIEEGIERLGVRPNVYCPAYVEPELNSFVRDLALG